MQTTWFAKSGAVVALAVVAGLAAPSPSLAVPNGSLGSNCAGCHGNPTIETTPVNGGTLTFGNGGHTLVGTSSSAALTIRNVTVAAPFNGGGFSGSFPGAIPGSGFAPFGLLAFTGEAGTGYITPTTGANSESRAYSYSPARRGPDEATMAFVISGGFNTPVPSIAVTFHGQGVAPVVSFTGSQTDVGNVRVGTTKDAIVLITNTGDGNLSGLGEVSNLRGTAEGLAGPFSPTVAHFDLADGTTSSVGYTFAPDSRGTASSNVSIQTNNGSADGTNAAQAILLTLNGNAVGPRFHASIDTATPIDFGTTALNASRQLTLSNDTPDGDLGDLTRLTLISYEIGGPDAGAFSLLNFTPGMLLAPGATQDLDVLFTASVPGGGRSATLTFLTDEGAALGSNGRQFSFALMATAVPEPGTAGLLVAGFGFLGALMRRRRSRG
ncbi:MAG: choice-of-anchor D domain-containing protein [Betaproteobacteria bacterium]